MLKTPFFSSGTDVVCALVLVGVTILVAILYSVRLVSSGRAHFERVEQQGGSMLLGKPLMEMAYWGLQPVGRFFALLRITPNMISYTSGILGALSGLFLAFGRFGLGALFASISSLLDSLDGIVARSTGCASDIGEVIDAAMDRYSEFFFLGGLVFYYRDSPLALLVVLLAFLGSFMVSYSTAKSEALHILVPRGNMRRPERALYLILGASLSSISVIWFENTFEPPLAYPMLASLFLVALFSNISAIQRFWVLVRAMEDGSKDSD